MRIKTRQLQLEEAVLNCHPLKEREKKVFTCWVQVSLKTSAMPSQTSFRADKEASAFTLVKKRVILRTNLCHSDYLQEETHQLHQQSIKEM